PGPGDERQLRRPAAPIAEPVEPLTRNHVPQVNPVVAASRGQGIAVGGNGQADRPRPVAREPVCFLPPPPVPTRNHALVARGADKPPTVRGQHGSPGPVARPSLPPDLLAVGPVPGKDGPVVPDRDQRLIVRRPGQRRHPVPVSPPWPPFLARGDVPEAQ